ncbi:MAG: hypothetical protein V1792_08345 [Pseudomonadota bacterium]
MKVLDTAEHSGASPGRLENEERISELGPGGRPLSAEISPSSVRPAVVVRTAFI